MKNILHIIFTLLPLYIFAQVGINNTNPLEELHISGATSSIRIEGLNSPNNTLNVGTNGNSPVYVNGNGDLVLGVATNNIEVLFSPLNYLDDTENNDSVITQTGGGTGFSAAGLPNAFGPGLSQFTLTKKAIIEINYSVSWKIVKNNTNNIDDANARIFQTLMYLVRLDGPGAPYAVTEPIVPTPAVAPFTRTVILGLNGQFYNNKLGSNGANDFFFNTGTDYYELPAGTYRPLFLAQIAVSAAGGTGAVKAYLGGGQDEVQVIAHYYK